MSQAVGIDILVLGAAGLLEALVDTGLACAEQRTFQTEDGKVHRVDLVVADAKAGAKVGVKIDAKTGQAQFIAHDCKSGGVKGKALASRIVQRYAYVKAVEELRRKGYKISKEETKADGSITVVAQRWR
jgi:hypothetical protein